MKKYRIAIIVASLFTVVVLSFLLVDGYNERKATIEMVNLMQKLQSAVDTLTPILGDQAKYDPSIVKEQAMVISNHSGEPLIRLFPKGSYSLVESDDAGLADDDDSGNEQFERLANRLHLLSQTLYHTVVRSEDTGQANPFGAINEIDSGSIHGFPMDNPGISPSGGVYSHAFGLPAPTHSAGPAGHLGVRGLPELPTNNISEDIMAQGIFADIKAICADCHNKFQLEE